jgi:hypothetical protein
MHKITRMTIEITVYVFLTFHFVAEPTTQIALRINLKLADLVIEYWLYWDDHAKKFRIMEQGYHKSETCKFECYSMKMKIARI